MVWSTKDRVRIIPPDFEPLWCVSIGQSQVEAVTKYIRDQKEHHKSQSYKDEFRALCAKYEIEINERFCWN
jgi:hypothetical protein